MLLVEEMEEELGQILSEGYQTIRRCSHSQRWHGPMLISKDWEKQLPGKRQATTKAKVTPLNFKNVQQQYLTDIHSFVFIEEIYDDLIIICDQTGVKYASVSNWMEVKGSKRVEVTGTDDKRHIATFLSCMLSRNFLLVQVVCAGVCLLACQG